MSKHFYRDTHRSLRIRHSQPNFRHVRVAMLSTRDVAKMRVLVTGVDGYIGAVLGSRLVERGFDVVGVDCGY